MNSHMSRRIVEGRTFTTYSPFYYFYYSLYISNYRFSRTSETTTTHSRQNRRPSPTETYNTGLYIGCLYLYMRVTNWRSTQRKESHISATYMEPHTNSQGNKGDLMASPYAHSFWVYSPTKIVLKYS